MKKQIKKSLNWLSNNWVILVGLFFFSLILMGDGVQAQIETLGTFQQNTDINLIQSCSNCTFINITTIKLGNGTLLTLNTPMTQDGTFFNYTLSSNYTSSLGNYIVNGVGDVDGIDTNFAYDFIITRTGESSNSSQAIITMGIIGVMFLFFGLGRAFKKEKWKLKLAFDILALLMAVVAINSFRIIVSESSNLGTLSMGALVAVIAILLFMVGYFLVLITIEIINYFKNKENLRWNVEKSAY